MTSLKNEIKSLLNHAIGQAFPQLTADFDCQLTVATQAKFGHFQCNSAMPLAKNLQLKPRDIAQEIVLTLKQSAGDYFAGIDIAGPGFINLSVSPCVLSKALMLQRQDPKLAAVAADFTAERIVIDFSSPNVAKEMHVGHLRSTIIGDCLANVLEYLGHDVLRLNHIGDWGTAFGMLIVYIQQQQNPKALAQATLADLMQWYRSSKQQFDTNADFAQAARDAVVKLQSGEPQAREYWQHICRISQKAYQTIYDLLQVSITTRGESFYNPWLANTLTDLKQQGLLSESAGAKCVFLPGFTGKDKQPLPMIVQKSDGGYNYSSTDLTAIKHRVQTEKAQRIIYVTDQGQQLHFKMLFACARAADFVSANTQLDHVPFGLVLGKDGKKIKTRSGEAAKLIDLLNDGIQASKVILEERHPEWSQQRLNDDATTLGIGAIKYADLSCHRQSDYQFNLDKMLSFDGNTAAFIQYAVVRINSILAKVTPQQKNDIIIEHASEISLAVHCLAFPEVLQCIAYELTPNKLCDYLYELACRFNVFYRDCRIAGSDSAASRIAIIKLCKRLLQTGLALLGITSLEAM